MTSTVLLALAVFGACAVEAVEALTLVLASGTSTGWRSAFEGTVSALLVLVVLVAAVGVPLVHYVPIDVLRVVIGGLLLVLGLGWLRKAVLRASGNKALHDEDAIYAATVAGLAGQSGGGTGTARSAAGFAVAFKGVLLEGLEVVLIVISVGASSHHLGLASVMAAAAALAVTGVGVAVARQLSEVPENAMKLAVGVMLSSFGLFWAGEGAGVSWPGSDAFILALVGAFAVLTAVLCRWLTALRAAAESTGPAPAAPDHGSVAAAAASVDQPGGHLETAGVVSGGAADAPAAAAPAASRAGAGPAPWRTWRFSPVQAARAFGLFWLDFLVGDTPEIFVGTLAVIAATLGFRHDDPVAIPLAVALCVLVLTGSAYRGRRRAPRLAPAPSASSAAGTV